MPATTDLEMKHAGEQALDTLEPLLVEVRQIPGLQERKRGTFYRRWSAFLHFHEDPAGLFGDLKVAGEFQRFPVNTRQERRAFVAATRAAISTDQAPRPSSPQAHS